MLKILIYLITIRFRKLFAKDDFLAIGLFIAFYIFAVISLNRYFAAYKYYFLLSVVDIGVYHLGRKDLGLLKMYRNFKMLLFIEYVLYSVPFLVLYAVNYRIDFVVVHLLIIAALLFAGAIQLKPVSYPFRRFDPFWIVCFRKYYLLLFILIVIFLNVMGVVYDNENLNIASILVVSLAGCIPGFKREQLLHVKMSFYQSGSYLAQQILASCRNAAFLIVPLLICLIACGCWNLLPFVLLVFILPAINILFKYSFFRSMLQHQLLFALLLGNIMMGLPLLIIPFLIYKSIQNIKNIQNVTG